MWDVFGNKQWREVTRQSHYFVYCFASKAVFWPCHVYLSKYFILIERVALVLWSPQTKFLHFAVSAVGPSLEHD